MSDGHHAHVENQVWLRAFLFAAVLVTIGVVAYGVLSVGLATGAHHAWEDALAEANGDTHDHHVIDAHLQFLTWNVAGNTILFMMIVYASFIGLAGLMNSSKAQADHGHDDHGHHGSASPIIMAVGVMLFMMGFPSFATFRPSVLGGHRPGSPRPTEAWAQRAMAWLPRSLRTIPAERVAAAMLRVAGEEPAGMTIVRNAQIFDLSSHA